MTDAFGASFSAEDMRWMRRALRLGRRGDPSPNPHVGAVVVRDGRCVGSGHHARAGEAHAEVLALAEAGELARGATLYVTLEPCSHYGRTPPCVDAIVGTGIRRVVVGARDPHTQHASGTQTGLASAGVTVHYDCVREEAEQLLGGFAQVARAGRPRVTLKAALSLDGAMAAPSGDSKWLTGESARRYAHRLRSRADAILTGAGTLRADDPALNVRHVRGRNPQVVVLSTSGELPTEAQLWSSAIERRGPTLILHPPQAALPKALLGREGILAVAFDDAVPQPLDSALQACAAQGINELLVEAGPKLSSALLSAGLVDRVALFVAPRWVGAAESPRLYPQHAPSSIADGLRLRQPRWRRLGEDVCVEGALLSQPAVVDQS